ncbi:hypothetical protein ANTQUA_LOCUS10030 [Anthophora quadrimaculata]
MKCIMFILLVFVACTTAEESEGISIDRFMQLFSISAQEVKTCIQKTGVRREHLMALEDAFDEDAEISHESIKKASCYLVCCAHAQGTMVGSKLQIEKIVEIFRDVESSSIDRQLRAMFIVYLKQCEKQVRDITDACNVAFVFMKCLHNKFENFQ